jgi:hypothetical protein
VLWIEWFYVIWFFIGWFVVVWVCACVFALNCSAIMFIKISDVLSSGTYQYTLSWDWENTCQSVVHEDIVQKEEHTY